MRTIGFANASLLILLCPTVHFCFFSVCRSRASSVSKYGGCDACCASCAKACYAAERVPLGKLVFHKTCLRCSKCNTLCIASKIAINKGQLYCLAKCYLKYVSLAAIGQTAIDSTSCTNGDSPSNGTLQSRVTLDEQATNCAKCQKPCYAAESLSLGSIALHSSCLRCDVCDMYGSPNTMNVYSNKLYCSACYNEQVTNVGPRRSSVSAVSHTFSSLCFA